jgi:hypothetical protein
VSSPIEALALNPRDPSTLLVGTARDGIFLTRDAGDQWARVTKTAVGQVNALAFSTTSAAVAYAATATGIYQSIDGGDTWQAERRGIPAGTAFQSIAVDYRNGSRVIAGTEVRATPKSFRLEFYRSLDGGTSWSSGGGIYNQIADNQVNAIIFDPADSDAVFAGTNDGSRIYKGSITGESWTEISTGGSGGVLALTASSRVALPTDPVPAPQGNLSGVRYSSATHHTVREPFLSFYNKYGGLKIFGLPLTEALSEGGQTVQYFERSRLVDVGGSVAVSPIGSELTAGRHFLPVQCCPAAGQMWFAATHHTLADPFLRFWRTHGGSLLFGDPVSEPLYEQNGDGTGRVYCVQYFENARFEYHPELAATSNAVTLGLLGRQVLRQRGWL